MQIGTIEIRQPIALAPMEDISDMAFRIICKRLGADLLYTEFTSSDALVRDIPKQLKKIVLADEERPVGIQLFGNCEETMRQAVYVAEKFNPDFIDINCGCWTKRHALKMQGAGLLRDLKLFEKVIKAAVRATRLPVTVKTRLGWDQNNIVILDAARIVEEAGALALAVHCRTRSQGYKGNADWSWLEKIRSVIKIPLIGNGDINTPDDVKTVLGMGCDGVMIGRAAIGNPWIFSEAKFFLDKGRNPPPPSLKEKIRVCLEHLALSVQLRGEREGVLYFRKFYSGYFKGISGVSKLRNRIMQLKSYADVRQAIEEFIS